MFRDEAEIPRKEKNGTRASLRITVGEDVTVALFAEMLTAGAGELECQR